MKTTKEWIINECINQANRYYTDGIEELELTVRQSPHSRQEVIEQEIVKVAKYLAAVKQEFSVVAIPITFEGCQKGYYPIDFDLYFLFDDWPEDLNKFDQIHWYDVPEGQIYITIFDYKPAKDCINYIKYYKLFQFLKVIKKFPDKNSWEIESFVHAPPILSTITLGYVEERSRQLQLETKRQAELQKPETLRPGEQPLSEMKHIVFSKPETIDMLQNILKGYFAEREADFKKALQGEKIENPLLFPHNQNKFVEVFKRVKYNGLLISSQTEIKDWICTNFNFRYKRGPVEEIRPFKKSTVWDILTKEEKEPTKKERICIVDWLPHKSKSQLDN